MPSPKSLTARLMLLPLLLAVSSCSATASGLQTYPPADLLISQPAPVPSVDIVTSAQANQAHQNAKDTWGAKGWATVHAICVWAKDRGMTDAPC